MATARPLNDITILRSIVENDDDLWLTAVWAHVLRDAIDAGEIAFPIVEWDELEAFLARGEATTYAVPAVPGQRLRRPDRRFVSDSLFPCLDMADFVRKMQQVIAECRKASLKTKTKRG